MSDLLYRLNARDEISSVNEEWLRFARANDGEPSRLRFRCDAPDRRRFLELDISAGPDRGLIYRVRTMKEEERRPVALVDPRRPRSERLVGRL